jgi:hypothetical protein
VCVYVSACVDLLEDNIDTINRGTENITDASKEVCLEINIEKTKHIVTYHGWVV